MNMNTVTKRIRDGKAWSIKRERNFIENIGTFAKCKRVTRKTRKELLTSYRQALDLRTDWDLLERSAVVTLVDEAIHAERR